MKYAIGIDIGGTNTRVALVNEDLKIENRTEFKTFVNSPFDTIDKIYECIVSFKKEVVGIGVSCPGPLDLKKGIILTPPNLPKWHNLEIVNLMKNTLILPTYLDNDANLACLGEAVIGAGKDKSIVQFLTISTGVGSGLCIDQKIYWGAHGYANEIANMILWKDGPSIGALKKGSIESIASGTALTKHAIDAGLAVIHAGEVHDLALAYNDIAIQIMDNAYEYLSSAIATIFALNDPDVIVLSGSVALKIDGFVEEIEKRVKLKVYEDLANYVSIVKSGLDEDSGLIGAAYLALQKTA